jgi:hypothetical protein
VKQKSGPGADDLAASLGLVAGVRLPWRVSQHAVDSTARSVHLWVTQEPEPPAEVRRPWFGFGRVVMAPRPAMKDGQVWRHLDCMGYACFIHTLDRVYEDERSLDWLGADQMPFTHALSRKVLMLLAEGVDLAVVCELLRLPFAEVWKFRYALDSGQLPHEYALVRRSAPRTPAAPGSASVAAPVTTLPASEAIVVSSGLPEWRDPVWVQLISGELPIEIRTLGFQLLLARLRQQLSQQPGEEVLQLKLRELHRYVQRHERVLGHELQQLQALRPGGAA